LAKVGRGRKKKEGKKKKGEKTCFPLAYFKKW